MKKGLFLTPIFLVFLLFPPFTYAGQWSGSVNITKIYPNSNDNGDGTIYFEFSVMNNPDGECESPNYIALLKSNKLESEIYSLALSAYMANKQVTYYVNGCDALGHPVLLHMNLH